MCDHAHRHLTVGGQPDDSRGSVARTAPPTGPGPLMSGPNWRLTLQRMYFGQSRVAPRHATADSSADLRAGHKSFETRVFYEEPVTGVSTAGAGSSRPAPATVESCPK